MVLLFRLIVLCAVAAAATISCSPATRIPAVHEPLDSAEWQRCAGELQDREAVAMIDDLTLDSKTMLCQGVTLAASGKVDEGLELLTESGVRDKEDHRPHYLAGRILAEAGRYEEALSAFERSAKRFPTMEVPTERLGRKLLDKSGRDEARLFLKKARERGLCLYGCLGLLARLHHESGDDATAQTIYNEMVKSDPAEPAAYVGLAGIRNKAKKYSEEAAMLTRASQSKHFDALGSSGQADILYSLSFAKYNASNYDDASKTIDQAIALKNDRADWYVLAGWIDLKRNNYEAALTRFEKAVSADERLGAAHTGIGDVQMNKDQPAEAAAAYKRARELDPMNAVIILKLAHATALAGDLAGARNLVDEAAAIDKDHLPPELLARVTDLLKGQEAGTEE